MTTLLLLVLLSTPSGSPNSAALFMESQLAMMKGNMTEAETLVLEAMKQDPGAMSLRIAHAEILLQKGDYGKARETLEAVLREEPAQADALNLLSSLSAARQDWARSEEYLRRAYALHKSESNAYMLAQTLARQERFAEAAEVLKGFSSPASLKMLAALHHALGDARSEEAALQELHGNNPADREVLQSLATLLEQEERPLQAALLLEKIPPQDRSSALRIRMASLYRKGGDCARALELLAEVPSSRIRIPNRTMRRRNARSSRATGRRRRRPWRGPSAPDNATSCRGSSCCGSAFWTAAWTRRKGC